MQKPLPAKGTRDFESLQIYKRNYILDVIKKNFTKYGYFPLETPSFEKTSTLLGKYGEEGEHLIFKILKSGNFLKGLNFDELDFEDTSNLSNNICDKALKYDLTVPFARYVSQNFNELIFPFKRSQIQNVWRADKPQKGRFREFLQCDADVIGSKSLMQEIEFICLFDNVFNDLNLNGCIIKLNNRKILLGLCEILDCQDKFLILVSQLDKLDKLDSKKIKDNLKIKGFSSSQIDSIFDLVSKSKNISSNMDFFKKFFEKSSVGIQGLSELEFIFNYFSKQKLIISNLVFDISLARGIDYYTGVIFEVIQKDKSFGSIAGGGRYDNLTEIFGLNDTSGIGISFGLDRIYLTLHELKLFPKFKGKMIKVLFTNFGTDYNEDIMKFTNALRNADIIADFYPDPIPLKKQLKYANQKEIPFVILYGEEERKSKFLRLKNMNSGDQQELSIDQIISKLKKTATPQ
jgi:histidyl-tRNA synthetase